MDENPTIRQTIHPDFHKELQTVLSTYFEDILGIKGAGGQGAPRRLQNPRRSLEALDPPAPCVANGAPGVAYGAPAPVDQALLSLWILPLRIQLSLIPLSLPARPSLRRRARARARARAGAGPKGKKRK